MGIFRRLSQLIRSNVSSVLDKMSDPAKEIDYLIVDMERELKESRVELRNQLAQEKLLEKRAQEAYRQVQRFQDHAQRAVQAGDDNLAREALRRLQDSEQKLHDVDTLYQQQRALVLEMMEKLKHFDRKLATIKLRKETLKVQAKMSKQSSGTASTAFERFEEIEARIEMGEYQANAWAEVNSLSALPSSTSTTTRFDRLLGESGSKELDVEQRLQSLKSNLNKP